ncbi:MAG: bifunctional D-glycero-beta-D-manno-heptose-7-phosphate kinase/D-glycero-beta-D-manno-heptose 1-phosphate adenylyltransferase HldE [Porticoccaceae bacterium]|nr:bifunctional D-glycero-beta-D-manno-heptose-7-phosphate kinase/D-glycero-beta-D-manno-heptose 1-phosphate adenylyltransferase HldE [Porticoccaceae bacterium]
MDLSYFQNLNDVKILVVGDVMLDRYWHGDTGRISPEAPVPVVKVSDFEDKAGGAANVAKNIVHLGAQASLLGIIGDDDNGQSLQASLEGEGISSLLVKQDQAPTITKIRILSRSQQVVRLDIEQPFSQKHADLLSAEFETLIEQFEMVLFSDYNKGSLANIGAMISVAKKAGKTVLVDPKSKDLADYAGADFLTPNLTEYHAAGGASGDEEQIEQSAKKIIQDCNIGAMLLTRSEQGMSLITPTEKFDFPAQTLEVADVTGAGDTVIATLAVMLATQMPASQAVEIANIAAGITVTRLGAVTVSPEELSSKLATYLERTGEHYHPSVDEVFERIEQARRRGDKIVFTNGCFDILHAGHVRYLAQAKTRGDKLVVGLNNDDSISRLKGADRPINPLEERVTVLTALASVDWVISFGSVEHNDTPANLIQQLKPDVLVKGGDYKIDEIAGADFVLANGGNVEVLEFVNDCSTSNVISKIKAT